MTVTLRELLKRSSLVVNALRSGRALRDKWASGSRSNLEIVTELAAFRPNSAGSLQELADLALKSAQQTFPLICSLIGATSQCTIAPQPIEAFFPQTDNSDTSELAALFNRHGSDKSTLHNYHLLYAPLLASRRHNRLRLLEIGIGTNNPDVVSNMGISGKPGASLRAFRDFCPNAEVMGADIDKQVLFEEERIRTYYVDQTQHNSFDELYVNLGDEMLDLVIDDGLHSPNANIATMLFALKILRPTGLFIVEDIPHSSMPVWQVIAAILPRSYHPTILQTKNCLLFMIQKPS